MLKYKLTNQNNETYNSTIWGKNITHTTDGSGDLCSSGWLHFYHSPELAALMNPYFGNIEDPKLWECEALGSYLDDFGLKGGCTNLTTTREIPLPKITDRQRVKFAILCAKEVYHDKEWNKWADEYCSSGLNTDIVQATSAAYTAAFAAYIAAYYATDVAHYVCYAAYAASHAARAAEAATVVTAAYYAAEATVTAAYYNAYDYGNIIDFQLLAEKALDNRQ